VNQTFKLLAVVGNHSLRVIELPRKTTTITSSTSNKIQVRCLEIGKFYHSLPGSPSIVKICWHPLGQHSSSLLVLTSTAAAAPRDRGRGSSSKLFEYTLHESSQEPSQIIDFFPSSSSDSKGGGFSAEDSDGARELTGMCFGDTFQQERQEEEGAADWGKMTIYGLFKNGDVRSICPFLPKRT
jgi:nucleoporin NUP82